MNVFKSPAKIQPFGFITHEECDKWVHVRGDNPNIKNETFRKFLEMFSKLLPDHSDYHNFRFYLLKDEHNYTQLIYRMLISHHHFEHELGLEELAHLSSLLHIIEEWMDPCTGYVNVVEYGKDAEKLLMLVEEVKDFNIIEEFVRENRNEWRTDNFGIDEGEKNV